MNYRLIVFVFGELALILAALMCVPLIMALGFGENSAAIGFAVAIAVCVAFGILGLALRPPKDKRDLRPSSGFAICGLFWILVAMIGALPFCVSKAIPNYIDALFETVSGFTTTGSSIIPVVEDIPRALLFWRAFTQWIGGMGVLVFIIAILPRNDKMSTALAKAEIPGPQFGKLVSKLRFTSRILYAIYIALTLMLVALLCICGMPAFDAFCHAFATASTGGFTVVNGGILAYNNIGIEVTITIFMILFSVNFNIYYFILIGHIFKALKNEELICMLLIYLGVVAAITADITLSKTYSSFGEALRYASFDVASAMSTTGFGTGDFATWPVLSQALLLCVMCIGGSAGSTAGGIKVSRLLILSKSSVNNLRTTLSPRSVRAIKLDGKAVDDATVTNVRSFFIIYAFILMLSTALISIGGSPDGSFGTNFSAVIACFNNIGPGMGAVGPYGNYAGYDLFAKIVLTFDMLLGRLEILPILMIFMPKSWRRIS